MATDTIFMLGEQDPKLCKLLSKLGYDLKGQDPAQSPKEIISQQTIDLIVINSRTDLDCINLCQYLRADDATKKVPIVYLASKPTEYMELKELRLDKVELVPPPYSIGTITSKIATNLRMRKMDGASNPQAGLAEANAALRDLNERFRREREQARAIQQSLLPQSMPQDSRFEIAASYQPLEEVGGDWYFVQKEANNQISLHIADVTGHGLSAAFIGAMTKLAMSATGKCVPHELLKGMNDLMTPQLPEGRFVTMESCLYDPATGALQIARAGHPAALVVRSSSKSVEEYKSDGFALGFLENVEYQLVTQQLEVGDSVILITDGISEAQNRNRENFGDKRLLGCLKEVQPDWTAQAILDYLFTQFKSFTEGRLIKDDVTLVILKRLV